MIRFLTLLYAVFVTAAAAQDNPRTQCEQQEDLKAAQLQKTG